MTDYFVMDVDKFIANCGGVMAVARRLGVSHPTVCQWRRIGAIPGRRLRQICDEFGLPIETVAALIRPLEAPPPLKSRAA